MPQKLSELKSYPFMQKFEKTTFDPGLYGVKFDFYTSNKFKDQLVKIFDTNKPLQIEINRLLESGKIKIGYFNPGFVKFMKTRFEYFFGVKKTYHLGFYNSSSDEIYICLDENVNMFGNEIFDIRGTVIHELCHMAAVRQDSFINLNMKVFVGFFSTFMEKMIFFNMFGTPVTKIEMSDLKRVLKSGIFNQVLKMFLKRQISMVELKGDDNLKKTSRNWSKFVKSFYYNLFGKDFDKIEMDRIRIECEKIVKISNPETKLTDRKIVKIKEFILKSYSKMGINTNTQAGQEIKYVSEIVAIYHQTNPNNKIIAKMAKTIK